MYNKAESLSLNLLDAFWKISYKKVTRDQVVRFLYQVTDQINACSFELSDEEFLIVANHYNLLCDWIGGVEFKLDIKKLTTDLQGRKINPLEVMTYEQQTNYLNKIFVDSDKFDPNKQPTYQGETFKFCVGNEHYKPHVIMNNRVNPDMPIVEIPMEYLATAIADPIAFVDRLGGVPRKVDNNTNIGNNSNIE